ncbi:MAG: hypothetical protein ACK4IS_09680 [Erythrobacter sp.]
MAMLHGQSNAPQGQVLVIRLPLPLAQAAARRMAQAGGRLAHTMRRVQQLQPP